MERSARLLHACILLLGGPALGHLVDLETYTVEQLLHLAGFPRVEFQRPAFQTADVGGGVRRPREKAGMEG